MHGGTIDQDVERAELLVNIPCESFNAGGIRHVEAERNYAARMAAVDCPRGGVSLGRIARGQDDRVTDCGKLADDLQSDPAVAAADQRDGVALLQDGFPAMPDQEMNSMPQGWYLPGVRYT
jgi:hypothetical protein